MWNDNYGVNVEVNSEPTKNDREEEKWKAKSFNHKTDSKYTEWRNLNINLMAQKRENQLLLMQIKNHNYPKSSSEDEKDWDSEQKSWNEVEPAESDDSLPLLVVMSEEEVKKRSRTSWGTFEKQEEDNETKQSDTGSRNRDQEEHESQPKQDIIGRIVRVPQPPISFSQEESQQRKKERKLLHLNNS